jgi:putative phosphoribosyl transferase
MAKAATNAVCLYRLHHSTPHRAASSEVAMQITVNASNGRPARFRDRRDAGLQLANELRSHSIDLPIVIALPRGGVKVGYEVARALHAPLDVWVVRKVGVPWHPELGVGAVAEGGYLYLSRDTMETLGLSDEDLSDVVERERLEVEVRVRRFRSGRPRPDLSGRSVLLVDDGIATGGTVRAAVRAIRAEGPKRIMLAVPVAAADTLAELAPEVDQIVCLLTPRSMHAIGLWYEDFRQVSSDEVVLLLDMGREEQAHSPTAATGYVNL